MATLSAFELPVGSDGPIEALSSADEQARILLATARREPGAKGLRLEDGLVLAAWERALLYREARRSQDPRDVRGEALTLLRARAAEWRIRGLLAAEQSLDLETAEAAALLLDRTLADIGDATGSGCCEHAQGLERIAGRLHQLYERVAETSLRLKMGRGSERPRAWRLAEVGDDEFELAAPGEVLARRPAPPMPPMPPMMDVIAADFALEGEEAPPAPSAGPAAVEPDLDDLAAALAGPFGEAAAPAAAPCFAPAAAGLVPVLSVPLAGAAPEEAAAPFVATFPSAPSGVTAVEDDRLEPASDVDSSASASPFEEPWFAAPARAIEPARADAGQELLEVDGLDLELSLAPSPLVHAAVPASLASAVAFGPSRRPAPAVPAAVPAARPASRLWIGVSAAAVLVIAVLAIALT